LLRLPLGPATGSEGVPLNFTLKLRDVSTPESRRVPGVTQKFWPDFVGDPADVPSEERPWPVVSAT
jgi:hypothetical protein